MGLILTVPLIIIANVLRKYYFSQHRNSSLVTYLKQEWTENFINISKYWQKKRLNIFSADMTDQIDKTGIVPSKEENDLEEPVSLDTFQSGLIDEVSMSGFNFKGDSLILKIARKTDFRTEVFLFLNLKDKGSFQLPFLPDSRAYSSHANEFSSCGLKVKCLSAFRRWRISYNGFLKKMDIDKSQEEVMHVKFSFVWSSVGSAYDFQTELNSSLLSESMCKNFSLFPYRTLNKFKKIFNNYEQWGQYIGTICINNDEEELLLWGPRRKNRGTSEWNQIKDYVKMYGYFKDGTMFNLGKINVPESFSNLKFGYVIPPNRIIKPMESCYFDITSKEENNIPCKLIFRAGGKSYVVNYEQLNENSEVFYGENGEIKSCIRLANYTLEGVEGRGYFEFTTKNETGRLQPSNYIYPCLLHEDVQQDQKIPFVANINEKICRSDKVSGGKGYSLAMLCKLLNKKETKLHSDPNKKFFVPRGLIITTSAYKHHMKSHNLSSKIASLYNCKNCKELEERCRKLTEEFSQTTLSENIKQDIKCKLEELFSKDFRNVAFAVRSSASGEDSVETSAAGQMDTYLGIRSIDQIYRHVVKCWSSQFSNVAVNYKRQTGQSLDSNMAVVVQEMVPAQIAGVAFTCDPTTGNPARITITANYGLGESVVSAACEPDTVVLGKNYDNTLFLESQTIGEKRIKIQMSDEGGTTTENVTVEQGLLCCLQPEDALRIGHVSILIEQCFGSPRDIEWAIVNNDIYLLQARPITTNDLETDFEIIHEFDTAHLTDSEYLTKANIGEVMPNAISPLTISTTTKMFELLFQESMHKNLSSRNPYIPEIYMNLILNFNHSFISIISLMRVCFGEDDTSSYGWQQSIFGRILENTDELRTIALKRFGIYPKLNSVMEHIILFWEYLSTEKRLKVSKEELNNKYIRTDTFTSPHQLYSVITQRIPEHYKACNLHILCSTISSLFNSFVVSFLTNIRGEMNEKLLADFSKLISDCETVESMDVPNCLKNLANEITKHGERENFLKMNSEEAVNWLAREKGNIGIKYNEFLEQHGHRGLMELDLLSLPWGLNPTHLVKSLQVILKDSTAETEDNKKTKSSSDAAVEELQLPANRLKKYLLKKLVILARGAVSKREKSKSVVVKSVDIYRRAYGKLGEMMENEGRIPDSNLIFFFTHEEIGDLLKSRSAHLISKALRRKKQHKNLHDLKFDEIVCGFPKPITEMTENLSKTSDWVINAMPICQGIVIAPARVIKKFEEAENIQPGDVLVTYSTDVGWTPYFPKLSGIVTELGGLLSHGAVVAREFGIPCIIGARGATAIVKNGDIVELNGKTGTLKKI